MRVKYEEMVSEFKRVLEKYGFDGKRAEEAAEIFAQNSLAGVYSHGLNRFPRVVEYLKKGEIDPNIQAECTFRFGAFERWDGHRGFGPLNARQAMKRAVELAKESGIGIVALGNMPAWGGKDCKLGNNPLIMAIPRSNGEHVVVDCAMSQFSYGKMEDCRLKGQKLPVPGGYDSEGNLTDDPGEIEQTRRVLPMGYWKGSGISIGTFEDEVGLNQIMIAIDPGKANPSELTDSIVDQIVADIKSSTPEKEGGEVLYPGERVIRSIRDNKEHGIPVIEEKWNQVLNM